MCIYVKHKAERARTIVADQKGALSRAAEDSDLIDREALARWEAWAGEGIIKVITGARRAGKPVFAMQLAQVVDEGYAYAYVNFDDERPVGLKAGELDKRVEAVLQVYGCTRHLILDEIHNLDLDGGALRQQAPEAGVHADHNRQQREAAQQGARNAPDGQACRHRGPSILL